jgi:hypothetical protein
MIYVQQSDIYIQDCRKDPKAIYLTYVEVEVEWRWRWSGGGGGVGSTIQKRTREATLSKTSQADNNTHTTY